jgi:mono/diheme cytochrome c family protein
MARKSILFYSILILSAIWISSCQSNLLNLSQGTPDIGIEEGATPIIPEDYATLSNPLSGDATSIESGKILYEADCASCHGVTGHGDGSAASGLDPKPGDLATNQKNLSDSYLYWRISEGGLMEPFNSMMPAWKGILREDLIWQIILYLRTLS